MVRPWRRPGSAGVLACARGAHSFPKRHGLVSVHNHLMDGFEGSSAKLIFYRGGNLRNHFQK